MNWFHPWPVEALQGVVEMKLDDMEVDDAMRKGI